MTTYDDILATQPDHLIAYWPMDDGAGQNLREVTGFLPVAAGHNLQWENGACYFDGTAYANAYSAALAAKFSSANGTILIDFQIPIFPPAITGRRLFSFGNTGQSSVRGVYGYNTKTLEGDYYWSTDYTYRQKVMDGDGNWHRLVIGWRSSNSKMNVYVNGKKLGTERSITVEAWSLVNQYAMIGSGPLGGVGFVGYLRNCAIWDTMLSDQEILALGDRGMATTEGQLQVKYKDYDGEVSSFHVVSAVLTAANFDAQAALRNSFLAAVAAVVLGERQEYEYRNRVASDVGAPDDPTAQRELAWKVTHHDDTSKKTYNLNIGTPLLTALDPDDRAHAEIGDADIVDAWVDAFEAYGITKDGNAPVVDEITLIGRNL